MKFNILPRGLKPSLSGSLHDEFKKYLAESRFKDFFALSPKQRALQLTEERTAVFEELSTRAQGIQLPRFRVKLSAAIQELIEHDRKGYTTPQEMIIHQMKRDLSAATDLRGTDPRLAIQIYSKVEKVYARNFTQKLFTTPLAMTCGALPISKVEFPVLYGFLGTLCSAYNIAMPQIYVGQSTFLNFFGITPYNNKFGIQTINSATYIDDEIFCLLNDSQLKAFLIHELAHRYYNDYPSFDSPKQSVVKTAAAKPSAVRLNHFQEYRADGFALDHGYKSDLIEGMQIIVAEKRRRKFSTVGYDELTHPSAKVRIQELEKRSSSLAGRVTPTHLYNKGVGFFERTRQKSLATPTSGQLHRADELAVSESQAPKP